MKDQPNRRFRLEYDDGSFIEIEIAKVTVLTKSLDKVALHIDHIGNDKFLLIANEKFLPEGKKLNKIDVIREG